MSKRRVVITGMGAVSPFGAGVDKLWENISQGKSGIKTIDDLDLTKHLVHFAGQADVDMSQYFDIKEIKKTDRFTQHALIAAEEAVKLSGLDFKQEDMYRVGVIVSSAAGGFKSTEIQHKNIIEKGPTRCSPYTIPLLLINIPSGKISIKYGIKGICKAVVTACATSTHSIGDAFRSIQYNDADIMLAGGCEAVISDLGMGGFTSARTLSRRNGEPEKASRPYDKDRDGFVMAEGGGVMVLEEYEHAVNRGAKIYAEIVGYGQTADAYDLVAPSPDGAGAEHAMLNALVDADLKPEAIDYINTHGTSTGLGDKGESLAVEKVFGNKQLNSNLCVSSTKSMMGHALGAAGVLEAIICVEAINEGIVPPTINLDNQDPEVADLNYVPNKPIKKEVKYAMNNSFGFGGQNGCLIFKKF